MDEKIEFIRLQKHTYIYIYKCNIYSSAETYNTKSRWCGSNVLLYNRQYLLLHLQSIERLYVKWHNIVVEPISKSKVVDDKVYTVVHVYRKTLLSKPNGHVFYLIGCAIYEEYGYYVTITYSCSGLAPNLNSSHEKQWKCCFVHM